MVVSYTSDFFREYAIGLDACSSRERLNEFLEHWLYFASDAYEARPKSETEFDWFILGLKRERKGKYAGDEWAARFGAILMPETMFGVAEIAIRFGVPWGLAFIRAQDAGLVVQNPMGVYLWRKPIATGEI